MVGCLKLRLLIVRKFEIQAANSETAGQLVRAGRNIRVNRDENFGENFTRLG